MNIIDVLAILPYYVELWMAVEKQKKDDFSGPHNNFLPLNLTEAGVEDERTEETEEVNTGNPNHSPHHTSDSKLCTNVNTANTNVFQIEEN